MSIVQIKWILIALLLFFTQPTFSAISNFSVNGGSFIDDDAENTYIIYAGTAGSSATCISYNTDNTCNNCDGTQTGAGESQACNFRRVISTSVLTLSFSSETSGTPVLFRTDDSTNANNVINTATTSRNGNSASISVTFGAICSDAWGALNGCETTSDGITDFNASGTFNVGIDANNNATIDEGDDTTDSPTITIKFHRTMCSFTDILDGDSNACGNEHEGIVSFEVKKGDEKIFIRSIDFDPGFTTFPTSETGIQYENLLVFAEPVSTGHCSGGGTAISITNATPYSITEIQEVGTNEYEPADDTVRDLSNNTSLTNGINYVFKLALQDQAKNIGLFTTNANCNDATPEPVVGLLSETQCFIATASYGSWMEPEVETFRSFRDSYLKKSEVGNSFIDFYYKHSPPLANWISKSEIRKQVSRIFLWPALIFAKVSVKFGLMAALVAYGFLISLFYGSIVLFKRTRLQRRTD